MEIKTSKHFFPLLLLSSVLFVSFTRQEHSSYRWSDKYARGLHICVAQFHITAGRTGVCQILFKLVNCGFVCISGKNYCAYETVFRSFHFVVIWYNKLFSPVTEVENMMVTKILLKISNSVYFI